MKVPSLFLILYLFGKVVLAQPSGQISRFRYQHTISFFGTQTIARVEDLFYNGAASVYVTYDNDLKRKSQDTTMTQQGGGNVFLNINSADDGKDFVIYKEYSQGRMVLRDILENGKRCIVNDSIPKLTWKLLPDKRRIGPYECQKATTTFRCANYVVWFTKAIPVDIGPWKLSGLPGLIVEATDERENATYKFSLLTAEYPVARANYAIVPPNTGDVVLPYKTYVDIQKKEIEKKRIFTVANSDYPANSGYFSVRAECLDMD